jgi:hypothetical protein
VITAWLGSERTVRLADVLSKGCGEDGLWLDASVEIAIPEHQGAAIVSMLFELFRGFSNLLSNRGTRTESSSRFYGGFVEFLYFK